MLNFLPSSLVGVIAGFLLFVNVLFWVSILFVFSIPKIFFTLAAVAPDNQQDSSLDWRKLDCRQQRMDAPDSKNPVGCSGIGGLELSRLVSGRQQSSILG